MTFSLLRTLPALLLSLFAFAFSGCASMQAGLPAGLGDVLGNVTNLTDGITNWRSSLGSMIEGTQLDQLSQYADQAGALGAKIGDMTEGLGEAMADPLGAISTKLQDMSGIDVNEIKNLAPNLKQAAVDQFAGQAGDVGELTKSFMDQFGN